MGEIPCIDEVISAVGLAFVVHLVAAVNHLKNLLKILFLLGGGGSEGISLVWHVCRTKLVRKILFWATKMFWRKTLRFFLDFSGPWFCDSEKSCKISRKIPLQQKMNKNSPNSFCRRAGRGFLGGNKKISTEIADDPWELSYFFFQNNLWGSKIH